MAETETQPRAEMSAEAAGLENMRLMNEIAAMMKEVPILESEKPRDVSALTRVEFPVDGGVHTFMTGHDYPYRGFPLAEFVDKIDLIKKLSRQIQSGFFHALKRHGKLSLLLVPLIPFFGRDIFYAFTYSFHRLIVRFRIHSFRYSQPIRELHRACSQAQPGEDAKGVELREMIRDIECMILEFDNAYRYRFQDIIDVFDYEALRKDPIKEISRVLDVMIEREKTEEIKDTWRLLKMFVRYYLRIDRKLLWMITNILLNINREETKLTVEDKWFCVPREDYSFAFMQNPDKETQEFIDRSKAAMAEREAQAQQL